MPSKLLDRLKSSFQSQYRREVETRLGRAAGDSAVEEADLVRLPRLVATYLRRAGVAGQPRVRNFRARFVGQMRNGRDSAWMKIDAEQHDFFDEPARVFLMHASMKGIPFDALHVYANGRATMRVRAAAVFDVVNARGPEMDQSETVTLFNDMCLLAPATLVDARVEWEELGRSAVRATFENAGHRIRADLGFDEAGDLAGFLSLDRFQSADGKTYRKFPWWTAVSEYRQYGAFRLASRGEARWREPAGEYAYARFVLEDIDYDVTGNDGTSRAPHGDDDSANPGAF